MDGPAVRSEPQKILAPTTTLPDLRKTPHSGGPLPPPFPPPDNASFTQMSPQNKDSLLQAQASLGAWLEGRVHTLQECVHTLQRELCTSDEERRRLLALNAELLRDAQVRDQLCKVQGRELWRLRQILTGLLPNLSLDPPSGIVKEVRHASEETRREGHGSVRGMLESAERRAQRASGNVPQKGPESRANDRSQEREHVTFDEPFKLSPVPLERHPLAEVEKSSELRAPERGRVGEGGRECKGDAIERSGKLSKCSEEGKPEQPGKEAGFVDRGGLRRGAVVDAEKGGKFCEPCCSKERQAELSLPQQKLSAAGVGKGDADPDASEPSLCPAGEPNPPKIVSSTLARDQSNPVKSTEAPSAPVVELQENGGMISPGGLFDPVGNGNADLMLAGRLAPCSGRRSSGIAPDMVVAMMQLAGRGQAVLSPLGKGGVIQATKGRDGKKEGEKEGSGCGVSESRGGEGGTADGDKRSWGVEGERGRRQKERQRKESEPGVREEVGEGEKYSQGETKSSEGRTSGGEKHYSGGEQENSDWVHEASNGEPGRRGELDGIKNRSNGATEDSVGGPAKEALSAAPGVASLQGGADDAGRQAKVEDAERPGPLLETIEAGSEEKPQGTREDCAVVAQVQERVCAVETSNRNPVDAAVSGLAVKVEAPEPPAGPLSKPSKAHEASSGGNNSAQPSTPGSRLELPPEEGVERSIRESNARQPSDLPIVRKKRTKRPLSGVRKKARTVASAFLRVTRKSPVSSSHPQGRLGDPSKTALHPLPSNLDRTASKLSMDALAKAAALVERGGLASPETGVETAVQPVKRAREELEKDGEGSSGSGDELPISKMGRKIQGGEVTRGKQRERHVEASVPVPRSALAGACGQGTGPKLRVPEVSRRLSTGLSGFTKLPTGPSLIRSAGLSERPRASNRAQLPGEKALPVRPGVSSPVVHDIEAKQRSKPGMGVPVTHNPESKQWSKLGESPWPCGKTELSGQKPGFSKPGESTRGAGWANVGVPSMNVIGRAVSGASQSLPHRLVQRMGTNGVVSQTRECEHAPAEKRVSPAGEKDRNGAPTGKPERLPGSQHPEVPPGKQQLSLAAASSQSGGAPKPSKPPGFHPPGTGAPQIQSAPALRRLPEIPPRRSDVSSTSGAFRAFAGGQPNRMRPSALSGVQPNAGIAGVAQNAPGSMRKGLEEYARLVGQRPGASFGAQDGGGAAEAAANPQMVQFWRRQEVLAKNMRLLAENDRGSAGSGGKSDAQSCGGGKKDKEAAKCLRCKCKKSKCLKLYCDCFAAGVYCSGCLCVNCLNTEENAAIVNERKAAIIRKEPNAFRIVEDQSVGSAVQRHVRGGCHCRKSQCQKEYCVCFQAGVPCTKECTCLECLNDVPRLVVRSDAEPQRARERLVT